MEQKFKKIKSKKRVVICYTYNVRVGFDRGRVPS